MVANQTKLTKQYHSIPIRKEVEKRLNRRWLGRIMAAILLVGIVCWDVARVEAYHYENKELGISMELPAKPTLKRIEHASLLVFPTGLSWGIVITEQKNHEQLLTKTPEEIRTMENRGLTDPRQMCEWVEIDRSGKYPVMLMVGRHNGNYSYLVTAFTGKIMYGFGRITTRPMDARELKILFESVKSLRVLPNFKGILKDGIR